MRISIGPSVFVMTLAVFLQGVAGHCQSSKAEPSEAKPPLGDIAREYRAKPRPKAVKKYYDDHPIFFHLAPMKDPQANAREQLIKQVYEAGRRYTSSLREAERISKLTPAELEKERADAEKAKLLEELERARTWAQIESFKRQEEEDRLRTQIAVAEIRAEEERRRASFQSSQPSSSSTSSQRTETQSESANQESSSQSQSQSQSQAQSHHSQWGPYPRYYPGQHCCRPLPPPKHEEPEEQRALAYRKRY